MTDEPLLEPSQALRDLETLRAIEECPNISQRDLSRRLGIALGLTNACISKMANKGLIKISRINSRSLRYHLTPAGFAAKARLSMRYVTTTVDLYRTAKETVRASVSALAAQGVSKVGLLGANDLAEIVGIVCAHAAIEIACVADENPEITGMQFMGRTVGTISDFEASGCEAVIVTYLEDADYWMEQVSLRLNGSMLVSKAL